MQTEALGWTIDDILLTTVLGPDRTCHLAISCKSNVQVTASRLPEDFVARCWQQWAKGDASPMVRGIDRLMLVTRGRNNAFMQTWSDLKSWAKGSDSVLTLGRIKATTKHREIFDSVKQPAADANATVSDTDIVAMVATMEVAPLDFHIANSEDEARAIGAARSLLAHSSQTEGKRLWEELVRQARDTRLGTGTLDVVDLWRTLRRKFALKDHPDYESSWSKVRALTKAYRATIETSLPSKVTINRSDEIDKLVAVLAVDPVCVVFGESGSGKSALVKTMLDERFSDATQVWFGPSELEPALNEVTRGHLGIAHSLVDVLNATVNAANFLVFDAAERLDASSVAKAKALVNELKERDGNNGTWHVVIVGQTQAWDSGTLQDIAGTAAPKFLAVENLPSESVTAALRSVKGLEWLASHSDAVAALANLQTLYWVMQSAALFQQQSVGSLSLPAIADKLWSHWTGNKASVQRLLIRLAEREAAFEHTFAISQLDGGEAEAFDKRPSSCPLRTRNSSGCIQFQHDLAADWTRFQRLKEIKADTAKWAALASNPFWHPALRMLGQLLLRQEVGTRTEWDLAFDVAETLRETSPLADDVLLDALFLDPNAVIFLDQRAEMLLAENGKRLLRLVRRFEHVATVRGMVDPSHLFPDLSLYIAARFRTPIFRHWAVIAGFLAKHRDRIAELQSPAIASLCERWLTITPPLRKNGAPFPFRREFAEVALASARVFQVERAKGVGYVGDNWSHLCSSALAGAPDLPADVSAWALEMAQRRPYRADVLDRVRRHRAEQAAMHQQRLKADKAYRERHERNRHTPTSISSGRKLPPWPLGPQRRIERAFRNAVLHSGGLRPVMATNADVAGEVLLACLIEDSPEESRGHSLHLELGVAYDHEAYPTAPWKSPFYTFLQVSPDAALSHLHQLVNFCTQRWVIDVHKRSGVDPPGLVLRLPDGAEREYAGDHQVFAWSQENSSSIGQLHCALAAVERWLCDQVDSGVNLSAHIDRILRATNSVAMLGVLVNVGKHSQQLLCGPLQSLLSDLAVYVWDSYRVGNNDHAFDPMAWTRGGEIAFELAKNWVFSPHRKTSLREIVSKLITTDREIGEFVLAASKRWVSPSSEKEQLEFRILVAELDHRNYAPTTDPTDGDQTLTFAYPQSLNAAITAFQQDKLLLRQALVFPENARSFLAQSRALMPQEAESVASLMEALNDNERIELDEDMKRAPRVAAAATLLLRGRQWLATNREIEQRAQAIVDAAIADISHNPRERHRYLVAHSHLEFAAYVVVDRWIGQPSKENDERLLRILTSDDQAAARAIIWSAYGNRRALGHRWWRVLQVALLWSGLSVLAPGYGDDDSDESRWHRWCRWVRTRDLSANASAVSIQPLALAKRVERLEVQRWRRRYAKDGRDFTYEPERRMSGGVDTHFLRGAFMWLFRGQSGRAIPEEELDTHYQIVAAFWEHQAWWLSGSAKEDRDEYEYPREMGCEIIEELVRFVVEGSATRAPAVWSQIFALGPKAHHAIGVFLDRWFSTITPTTDVAAYAARWRPMVEHVLSDKEWPKSGAWYDVQRLERQVLGFAASEYLKKMSGHSALIWQLRDLFEIWAGKRLGSDEDNLAGLCGFLGTEAGKPLRIQAVRWLADAMKADAEIGKWYRDRTSSAFMEFLDVLVAQHASELSQDKGARDALLELAAHAVSRQLTAALELQERIRRLS
jgi:hypothetical protein